MGKQGGAILLFVLVVLLLLAGLSTVGLKAHGLWVRSERVASAVSARELNALELLLAYQPQWEYWASLWPPSEEELSQACFSFAFVNQGGVCQVHASETARVWWFWQHQQLTESELTLIAQPMEEGVANQQLWALGMQLVQDEDAGWQSRSQRWYQLRHPVTGQWRNEEVEAWWNEASP